MAVPMDPDHNQTTELKSINDLEPRMQVAGKVTKTDLYGAFVDIGIDQQCLIHISKLSDSRVKRVTDVLKEGDEITAYVDRIDKDKGRVNLSLVKPPDVTWSEIEPGATFDGTITRIAVFGLFVDIGAERDGLLHSSNIDGLHGGRVEDHYNIGEEIRVEVLKVDRKSRKIDLAVPREEIEIDEEEEEEPLTSMEIAFQQAQDEGKHPNADVLARKQDRKRKKKHRNIQDDLLARTLEHRKS